MAQVLSDRQLAEFRTRLRDRHRALRDEIRAALLGADESQYADLAGQVHDLEEASVADLLEDLQLADIDRHVDEIRNVEAALQRIAEGTFGLCVDCGGEIGIDRLKAYPTAARCLEDQAAHEHGYAGAGRPKL